MNYIDAIQFLYALQLFGANFGLENTCRLLRLAGDPQKKLRFIHVAGTNGKGSTCAMLESIYRASGWRVGLYTSPHLVSFRERIQVNRELISEPDVTRLVVQAKTWLQGFPKDNHPTFFEVVTVIAANYFAEQKCDLVIWETGLGGRLDATNVVTPLASVITNVQFDHEKWLGNTIEAIAHEKAGIIKPRIPIVTAAEGAALDVIRATALRLDAPCHEVHDVTPVPALALVGAHQRRNAAVALKTIEVVAPIIPVADAAVRFGLETIQWPARFQVLRRGEQTIVLDGAHNPDGARALAEALRAEFKSRPLTLILGILQDKNWETICRTLAVMAGKVVVTRVASDRSASPDVLAPICGAANPSATVIVAETLAEALIAAGGDSLVVVTGSLYLVGEAMERLGLSVSVNERALNEWRVTPNPDATIRFTASADPKK